MIDTTYERRFLKDQSEPTPSEVDLKTVDQICVEMDQATSVMQLGELWNWVVDHRKKYPLIYVQFMQEHVERCAQTIHERHGVLLINRFFKPDHNANWLNNHLTLERN